MDQTADKNCKEERDGKFIFGFQCEGIPIKYMFITDKRRAKMLKDLIAKELNIRATVKEMQKGSFVLLILSDDISSKDWKKYINVVNKDARYLRQRIVNKLSYDLLSFLIKKKALTSFVNNVVHDIINGVIEYDKYDSISGSIICSETIAPFNMLQDALMDYWYNLHIEFETLQRNYK